MFRHNNINPFDSCSSLKRVQFNGNFFEDLQSQNVKYFGKFSFVNQITTLKKLQHTVKYKLKMLKLIKKLIQ